MVVRPHWHRALSALLALWFAVVLVEPAAMHACPMHSGAHAAAEGVAGDRDALHGAGDHAEHGAADATAAPSAPSPAESHLCTCLGDCSGGMTARAPEAHVAVVALTRLTTVAPGRPQHEYVAAWVDFVLPFANAPPAPAAA